jgi:hypothetical protein
MSKIAFTPNASGTATFTLASPATNTDRTLTLPDVTTTLVGTDATQTLTNKTIASSQLTGALPAIDGSALTGIATGSLTLLGTVATTSGTSVNLSGLTLTSYKQVMVQLKTVSLTIDAGISISANGTFVNVAFTPTTGGNTNGINGIALFDLTTGVYSSTMSTSALTSPTSSTATSYSGSQASITTATTSLGLVIGGGAFDFGSVTFYGVK